MKEVIVVGADWCSGCKALKPIAKKICEEMGYSFSYADFETDEQAQQIIKENSFRSLPVMCYINTENEPVFRYKVGGFDTKSIQSFLMDENDENLVEQDLKEMSEDE